MLEFAGLHIDPLVIGEKNSKIQGPNIKRKNNCIVNTGVLESKHEELRRLQQELENVQAQIANIRRIQRGEILETVESSIKESAKTDNGKQQRSSRSNKRAKRK
ncbi:7190_t:CDS:2 [Acaulospora colombiana]|uniref:7190_t:CDS:1 n=1 Tax=Acaulospora colombiana TaxID=27376 RepID=A0ACA9M4Q2_9GLOM|nr:7190_t:CDS:2 [Acaulospora colombiana]